MNQSNYYCFSEKGETLLPNQDEINEYLVNGIRPIIFIDSCVCLQIVKLVDFGRKATEINRDKIFILKEYMQKNNVELSPLFAIMELCSKKENFDAQKFWDFKHRIDFFRLIPLKKLKQMKYDFKRDYINLKTDNMDLRNPYPNIKAFQFNIYSSLLKIRLIAKNSLSKKDFEKNCNELLDWMESDLKLIMGVEYKLGLSIFGGNTEFRKMIGIDSNSDKAKKLLWGTTWDIFHSRVSINSSKISGLLGENLAPFFLTNDENLFKLFRTFGLRMVVDGEAANFGSSFVYTSGAEYPNFSEEITERQNLKMINFLAERFNDKQVYDEEYILSLVNNLEIENGII